MIQQSSLRSPQLHIQRRICKVKPFGKLYKIYLPRYLIVAEIMGCDENPPLLFCQTVKRRVRWEFCIP